LEAIAGEPLPAFLPGQFLTFAVPIADKSPDTRGGSRMLTRCYSLSDAPGAKAYRITIKRALAPTIASDAPPGVVSAYFHDQVREGHILSVKAPSGQFYLESDPNIPSVLIAGGIGVTPMMSMLLWANAEQPGRTLHLYYGVRNSADHAFRSTLERLVRENANMHVTVVYEQPLPHDIMGRDFQHSGYIDLDLLKRTLPADVRHRFYVCGPPPMMASLVPALRRSGVPEADIHFEAFGPASFQPTRSEQRSPIAGPFSVRFERSRRSVVWEGQDATLLDFAERKGLVVDSGCRSGSCGSCETRIVSGSVQYTQDVAYEVAAQHCLLCVTQPASALVLEA